MSTAQKILIHYFDPDMPRIKKLDVGDWCDLYTAVDVTISKGDFVLIPLGVSMKLPPGYEAVIAPRSSTCKKFGIIMGNSIGIIDNSYSGTNDQWHFPAYATDRVFDSMVIPKYTRLCQFRIFENQPHLIFKEVESLDEKDRGGFGSTGN